ncbi:2492_t:CDS:2, partial [Diversispora eburnea]
EESGFHISVKNITQSMLEKQKTKTKVKDTSSIKKFEFTLYNIKDVSKSIDTFSCKDIVYYKRCCYSLAISNRINSDKERLVALSCFDEREMLYEKPNQMYGNDEENWENKPQNSDVKIQLLKDKTVIIVVNTSGIYKRTLNNDKIIFKQTFLNASFDKIEKFQLPQQLLISLLREKKNANVSNALDLLHTSIIKSYFMVHSFRNRHNIIEMYSLITGDLEMLFERHESSAAPNVIRSSPIFAISQNEEILAFCRGTTSITLFLIENGLEITTKQLEGRRGRIYKIVTIEFIDNDSKLLIALEEETENLS